MTWRTSFAKPTRNWRDAEGVALDQRKTRVPAREVEIVNRLGMHARPAMQFVQTANKFTSSVAVCKGTEKVNGKSIMEMMMLAAMPGTKLRVECEGPDAEACLDALDQLVRDKFHED